MNKYGRQAQEAWKAASPTRYSQIQDPEDFFTRLGEEAQEQVDGLLLKIAGPDPQGEGYLEKVGRLNAARNQAEEIVRYDLLSPLRHRRRSGRRVDETSHIPSLSRQGGRSWQPRRLPCAGTRSVGLKDYG